MSRQLLTIGIFLASLFFQTESARSQTGASEAHPAIGFDDTDGDGINRLFRDANGDGMNDVDGKSYPHESVSLTRTATASMISGSTPTETV
jgi:hypothetical protein